MNVISKNDGATIFHHPAWFNVLNKTYGFEINVYPLNAENSFIPLCINKKRKKIKITSLPFSDHCSILGDEKDFHGFINRLANMYPSISEIEIRDKIQSEDFKWQLIGFIHRLDLMNELEKLFVSFKKTQIQQCILKAQKDGLISNIRDDYNAVEEFYKLHLVTRKKLGVPIQPKKFFFFFWEEIIRKGLGYVILVEFNKKIISSGIFAGFNKILTYKYGAYLPDYLIYRPNNLMLWSAIQEAKRRGFQTFDFGRTDITTEGLRKFKQGWGTVEEPLYYSYYPDVPNNSKFKFVKNKIVAPIIKHSPELVCRLSGELMYKYFG